MSDIHFGKPAGSFRVGVDPELVAFQLERLAARVRAGQTIVSGVTHERAGVPDDWEGDTLTIKFHSKEGS